VRYRQVITSSDKSRVMAVVPSPGTNSIVDQFLQGYEGSEILVNSRGIEVLASVKHIASAEWLVSAQLPTAEAFAPLARVQLRMLVAALVMSVLSSYLSWRWLRHQLNPLLEAARQLQQQATAEPTLQPLPIKTRDEISVLISGFNALLAKLAEREVSLNNSEQRYRTLVEWSQDAILVHRRGQLVYANPAAVVLFEANSLQSLLGKQLLDLIPAGDRTMVQARIQQVSASNRAMPVFEQKCVTLKGNTVDLEIQLTPIPYDGEPATQSVLRNIGLRKRTEQALRQSEARFRRIVDSGMIGIAFWKVDGSILDANDTFLKMLGYNRSDLGHLNWLDLTPPQFQGRDQEALAEFRVKGTCDPYEKAFYRRDGRLLFVLIGAAIFSDEPDQGVAFILDVHQRRETEERLRRSEADLSITLDAIGDAVVVTDASGLITRMNPAAEKLSGWRFLDARGESFARVFNLIDASSQQPASNPVQLVLERDAPVTLASTTQLQAKNGHTYQVINRAAPIHNDAHHIIGVVLVFSDVSEDYRIRQSLERTTELLERTGELAKIGGWELDFRQMKTYWSNEIYRLLDYDDQDSPLSPDQAISAFAPEARHQIEAAIRASLEQGQPFALELPIITAVGRPIWIRVQGTAVYEGDKVVMLRGAMQDITESKVAADRLRLSEENLAITLNSIGDAVIATDADGLVSRMNPTAELLTGWSLHEARGRPLHDIFQIVNTQTRQPAEDPVALVKNRGQAIGLTSQTTLISRDGIEYQIFDSAAPIRSATGHLMGIVIVFSDVTEKYRTEEALKRSEASMAAAQARAHFGNWELDLASMRGSWSAENFRLHGLTPSDVAPDFNQFLDLVHPDDRATIISVNARVPDATGPISFEYRTNPEAGPERTLNITMELVRDFQGTPLSLVGTSLDITASKHAELALQTSLREKDALLKEVHHRVKNNLQVITSLLRLEASRNPIADVKRVLGDMQGRVRSMALLHESLYRTGSFAAVDLANYLRQLCTQVFRTLNLRPGYIQLELDLQSIHVEMDQALPCGLLVNELISNCLKHAFPDDRDGLVRVSLQVQETNAILKVSDNGIGLPANVAELGRQSLGLQLVADLAMQLNGRLDIGPGSMFSVTFAIALQE
jgi:PAS domain S-box-containing protein